MKTSPIIAIATCAERPELIKSEQYLLSRLPVLGVAAKAVVWNDPAVDWSAFQGVLIRTIWDYHQHITQYRDWVATLTTKGIKAGNPVDILLWNAHKYYLSELQAKGIRIPSTLFIPRGTSLSDIDLPWSEFVIKPAVSATAYHTYRMSGTALEVRRPLLQPLFNEKDMLIQQFIPSISAEGEYSLVFFAGVYSHCVLKKASDGEYRVQAEYGGSYQISTPPYALIRFAEDVLGHVRSDYLYARVDLVIYESLPMLMELELIEPELFLGSPDIQEQFATSIVRYFTPQ